MDVKVLQVKLTYIIFKQYNLYAHAYINTPTNYSFAGFHGYIVYNYKDIIQLAGKCQASDNVTLRIIFIPMTITIYIPVLPGETVVPLINLL